VEEQEASKDGGPRPKVASRSRRSAGELQEYLNIGNWENEGW
jgi:hypothetical protein